MDQDGLGDILLVGSDASLGWLELGLLLDAAAYPRANQREYVVRDVVRAEASRDMYNASIMQILTLQGDP